MCFKLQPSHSTMLMRRGGRRPPRSQRPRWSRGARCGMTARTSGSPGGGDPGGRYVNCLFDEDAIAPASLLFRAASISSSSFADMGKHARSTIDVASTPTTPVPDDAMSLPGSAAIDHDDPTRDAIEQTPTRRRTSRASTPDPPTFLLRPPRGTGRAARARRGTTSETRPR